MFTKASGEMTKKMVVEHLLGETATNTLENSGMTTNKEEEFTPMPTAINTKVNGNMMIDTVRVPLLGRVATGTREVGRKASSMGEVHTELLMERGR